MIYLENYGPYAELIQNRSMVVDISSITKDNWEIHFNSILNIMRDTIETDYCRNVFITIRFKEIDIDLSVIDYWFNLIMWYVLVRTDKEIRPCHLFFDDCLTRKTIKKYIDENFIEENRSKLDNIELNNIIDDCLYRYSFIDEFSFYLANTINLEDFNDLMNSNPEFNQLIHADLSNVPLEEVSHAGSKLIERAVDIIKNSDHCLAPFFMAGEGVNPKQFKEFALNIGTKPDGKGGVYPAIVNTNFLTGGVNDLVSNFIESSTGRTAQIIVEGNVGTSGHFARLLGLNNSDSIIHPDPEYVCDTKNFQELEIKSMDILNRVQDRYYRLSPNGMEYKISRNDTHLLGKKVYLRSPMTCASVSRTGKVCYRCYGDLAYTNRDINIGKMASELISSALTQMMLSAKHLLESSIKVMKWSKGFTDIFEVEYNLIKIQDDISLDGYKLIIDPSDGDEFDDGDDSFKNSDYSIFVSDFDIVAPNGESINIHTSEADNMYLTLDFLELIHKYGAEKEGKIVIDMEELQKSESYLFAMQILNNDLSRTLEKIKSIVDNSKVVESHDRNTILQVLLEALIEGGLNVSSIHAEIILSNQIRSAHDILLVPEWQYPNEEYKLLTLKQSLNSHPSVSVSVSYEKISKMLYNPLTYRKKKPSIMDLFFIDKPQNYLTKNVELQQKEKKSDNGLKPLFVKVDK